MATKKTTKKVEKQEENKVMNRSFEGVVVSVAEEKTVHVKVLEIKTDPKYRKQYKTFKKFAVHDEKKEAKLGDRISFVECRPISKTKKWRLVQVMSNKE